MFWLSLIFMQGNFSVKLQQIGMLLLRAQPATHSNSDYKLPTAPINLKPTPVTPAWLEVLEEVPIIYDFSISKALDQ